jgi:hypothetical protein
VPENHQFTAEPLTTAPSEIGTPASGQIHILGAEWLHPEPPEIIAGRDAHHFRVEPSRRSRKSTAYKVDLCRTVLRDHLWAERFPTRDELPHGEYLKMAKHALKSDRGTFSAPSFWPWRTLSKVIDGIALTEPREIELFMQCTGRTQLLIQPVRRLILLAGRRAGKDRFLSAVAVHRAALCADWRRYISAGSRRWCCFSVPTRRTLMADPGRKVSRPPVPTRKSRPAGWIQEQNHPSARATGRRASRTALSKNI